MSALRQAAAGALYHADLFPPRGPKRAMVRLNQALFERGIRPPWVWDEDRCRSYWATRTDESNGNEPASYAGKPQAIVEFLHGFWQPYVTPEMRILEVGCNAGANLHGLRERGYRNLAGVEINPAAIAALRHSFPELADAEITEGALEQVLPQIEPVDVVFSMAVLLHVHPSSTAVFEQMARLGRYVCVIEAESSTLRYIFARNYRRVFERLGCAQLCSARLTEEAVPGLGRNYYGYTARLFRGHGLSSPR
jgi:SAM-dependent methyltransferase